MVAKNRVKRGRSATQSGVKRRASLCKMASLMHLACGVRVKRGRCAGGHGGGNSCGLLLLRCLGTTRITLIHSRVVGHLVSVGKFGL